jgi:O-antigen ligase
MSLQRFSFYIILLLPALGVAISTYIPVLESFGLLALLVSISILFFGFGIYKSLSRAILPVLFYYSLFLLYSLIMWSIRDQNIKNSYTMFVLTSYFFVFFVTATMASPLQRYIHELVRRSGSFSIFFSAIFIFTSFSLGSNDPVTPQILLLFFCIHAAKYKETADSKELIFMMFCIMACAFTENRMIVIVMGIVFLLASMTRSHLSEVKVKSLKSKLIWLVIVALSLYLVVLDGRLLGAFLLGDNAIQVGEFSVNTAGRANIWMQIINDPSISLFFGSGNDIPVSIEAERWRHPHNDYLRIYSRLGVLGLLFFCIFLVALYRSIKQRLIMAKNSKIVICLRAALYLYFSVILMMITDNTLVYPVIMFPSILFWTAAIITYEPPHKLIAVNNNEVLKIK